MQFNHRFRVSKFQTKAKNNHLQTNKDWFQHIKGLIMLKENLLFRVY